MLGVNLTADGDTGQLDAYVQSAEWDLEGKFVLMTTDFHHLINFCIK